MKVVEGWVTRGQIRTLHACRVGVTDLVGLRQMEIDLVK
jgi:hypothetical protein